MGYSTKLITFTASWTMVQALVHLVFTHFIILEVNCYTDFNKAHPFFLWFHLLYTNSARCGPTLNVGQLSDSLPDQALVVLGALPLTTRNSIAVALLQLLLAGLWIFSSIYLLKGTREQSGKNRYYMPWLVSTLYAVFIDLFFGFRFLADMEHTGNLLDLVKYVGGTASGFAGGNVEGTSVAALAISLYCFRGGIGILINIVLFVFIFEVKMKFHIRTNKQDAVTQQEIDLAEDPPLRRDATVDRQEQTPNDTVSVHMEPLRNKNIKFPTSLLSIPQQLDIAMADQTERPQITVPIEPDNANGDDLDSIDLLEDGDEDFAETLLEEDTISNESYKMLADSVKAILRPYYERKKIYGTLDTPPGTLSKKNGMAMRPTQRAAWNSDVLY